MAAIGSGDAFTKGRNFAAWLGLVPKQISTGDRTILGKISKRGGNRYLRVLFVQAAWVVLIKPQSWDRAVPIACRGSAPQSQAPDFVTSPCSLAGIATGRPVNERAGIVGGDKVDASFTQLRRTRCQKVTLKSFPYVRTGEPQFYR